MDLQTIEWSGLTALGGLIVGGVSAWIAAVIKTRQDLTAEYDRTVRAERIRLYTELGTYLEPFARFAPPVPEVTYDHVRFLARHLREWYFKAGGLYLSSRATWRSHLRTNLAYWWWQHHRSESERKVPIDKKDCKVQDEERFRLSAHDEGGSRSRYFALQEALERILESHKERDSRAGLCKGDYVTARHLSSELRKSLARDVGTRSVSRFVRR